MFDKLDAIEEKYEELTRQLGDPETLADQSKYARTAKQHRDLEKVEAELKVLLLPKDPNDEKNVILEIRAGTGGDEATLFAAEIMRMYMRYSERQGWRVQVLDVSESGIGGVKEAT